MMILPPPTKLKNSSIVLQAYFKQYFIPLLKEKLKKSISVYKVQLYVMELKKIPKDRKIPENWHPNKQDGCCFALKHLGRPSIMPKQHYSLKIGEHSNNPRFLFITVVRLTESHSSTEPNITTTLSLNDFMRFITDKIITVREKIHHLLPSTRDTFSLDLLECKKTALNPETNYAISLQLTVIN